MVDNVCCEEVLREGGWLLSPWLYVMIGCRFFSRSGPVSYETQGREVLESASFGNKIPHYFKEDKRGVWFTYHLPDNHAVGRWIYDKTNLVYSAFWSPLSGVFISINQQIETGWNHIRHAFYLEEAESSVSSMSRPLTYVDLSVESAKYRTILRTFYGGSHPVIGWMVNLLPRVYSESKSEFCHASRYWEGGIEWSYPIVLLKNWLGFFNPSLALSLTNVAKTSEVLFRSENRVIGVGEVRSVGEVESRTSLTPLNLNYWGIVDSLSLSVKSKLSYISKMWTLSLDSKLENNDSQAHLSISYTGGLCLPDIISTAMTRAKNDLWLVFRITLDHMLEGLEYTFKVSSFCKQNTYTKFPLSLWAHLHPFNDRYVWSMNLAQWIDWTASMLGAHTFRLFMDVEPVEVEDNHYILRLYQSHRKASTLWNFLFGHFRGEVNIWERTFWCWVENSSAR